MNTIPDDAVGQSTDQFAAAPGSVTYQTVTFNLDVLLGEISNHMDALGYSRDLHQALRAVQGRLEQCRPVCACALEGGKTAARPTASSPKSQIAQCCADENECRWPWRRWPRRLRRTGPRPRNSPLPAPTSSSRPQRQQQCGTCGADRPSRRNNHRLPQLPSPQARTQGRHGPNCRRPLRTPRTMACLTFFIASKRGRATAQRLSALVVAASPMRAGTTIYGATGTAAHLHSERALLFRSLASR